MPISPARESAFRILLRVESGNEFAVDLLQGPRVSQLKEADRNLTTELVMGTLRRQGELDCRLEELSGKPLKYFDPEILTIFRIGLYQIMFLARIPKSAAVNEAVEMVKAVRKRSASGLVNAVLRKAGPPEDSGQGEGPVKSLPRWLAERWAAHFGQDGMEALARTSVLVPPATLRVVAGMGERDTIQAQLLLEGVAARAGKFSHVALIVGKGNVQGATVFREGRAVIQDEASQLVASLVAPHAGDRVLDLCAAPGIKTAQLAGALGDGLLVACDRSARRLKTMATLLPRSMPARVRLFRVRLDCARGLCFGISFDRILLDAPCSGTGTLARNPEIKWRLQPKDLVRLAEIQTRMLSHALQALSPNGRLVYATCSLEPEENEQVVEKVLRGNQGYRVLPYADLVAEFPTLAPLFDQHGFFRTRPDLHGMDGFFAAVIHRAS